MRNETVTVVVGVGRHVRPVVVWAGDRTRKEDCLVAGFERFERRPHLVDADRQVWKAEVDVPIGRVVTTSASKWPGSDDLFLATAGGLERISYEQVFDMLDPDPIRIAERAAQRAHDAAADAERLPRELARFVGAHGLRNGVHAHGQSYVYAERCTARQAYWRRATRAEAEACRALGAPVVPCMGL